MSSVGQALGGLVGGAIGFFLGGPVGALRGAQIGIMAGGLIDPPDGPVINGPRLDDLSVQTSTYGAFIPRNYGTIAQTGNVFWVQGDSLIEVQTTTESGGKGGPTQTTNTWSYYASFAVGLCQGPIDAVRRIWIGGQIWYDAGSDDLSAIIASNQNAQLFTLYLGNDTQTADPLMQADKGAANVPAYRGLAYIVFDTLPLENYGNSLAGTQVKVEIVKSGSQAYVSALKTINNASFPLNQWWGAASAGTSWAARSAGVGRGPPSPSAVSRISTRRRGPTQSSPAAACRPRRGPGQQPWSKSGWKTIRIGGLDARDTAPRDLRVRPGDLGRAA